MVVIRYPEITKNMRTPVPPKLARNSGEAWPLFERCASITSAIETARNPSSEGIRFTAKCYQWNSNPEPPAGYQCDSSELCEICSGGGSPENASQSRQRQHQRGQRCHPHRQSQLHNPTWRGTHPSQNKWQKVPGGDVLVVPFVVCHGVGDQ